MSDESPDFAARLPIPIGRRIVLASASPYRRKLLHDAGVEFAVLAANIDEDLQPRAKPDTFARELALRKAQTVASRCGDALVIGADTICAIGDDIIGKPADAADAERMIVRACETGLQRVITGVAIIDSVDAHTSCVSITSLVEMRPAPVEVIRAYVKSGEPMGKCGALCIESGNTFVKRWSGSYSNIMGLPLEWLLPELLRMASRQRSCS